MKLTGFERKKEIFNNLISEGDNLLMKVIVDLNNYRDLSFANAKEDGRVDYRTLESINEIRIALALLERRSQ